MSLQKIGLRYERLLVFSAPLSLACILIAFVAIGSDFAKDEFNAQCHDEVARIIEANIEKLQSSWAKREVIGTKTFANEYVYQTFMLVIGPLNYQCDYSIARQETTSALGPSEFAAKIRKDAVSIREQSNNRPIRSYGIELPAKATISLFGTNLLVNIYTLAQVMQVVLLPILALWLGSLFNTRFRETVLIGGSTAISDLYPHILNIYMNATFAPLRKRSRVTYFSRTYLPYAPSIVRAILLCLFIAPPMIFYCASLFFLSFKEHFMISFVSGLLLFIFFITNLLLEFLPWHSGKTFPTPKRPNHF